MLLEIDELIEYFTNEKKLKEKKVDFERLNLTEEKLDEITEAIDPNDLEEELASNVSKMKEYANNFGKHLTADQKAIERLSHVQNDNSKNSAQNLDTLIDFQKLSDGLSFFRLLKMGAIALVLFLVTFVFIFVDSFIF